MPKRSSANSRPGVPLGQILLLVRRLGELRHSLGFAWRGHPGADRESESGKRYFGWQHRFGDESIAAAGGRFFTRGRVVPAGDENNRSCCVSSAVANL